MLKTWGAWHPGYAYAGTGAKNFWMPGVGS